jgi:hypothetical protein
MSDYYPAGVTDAHPHFNPPRESATAVECGADEALVVPSHMFKTALEELRVLAGGDYKGDGGLNRPASMGTVLLRIEQLIDSIPLLEQEREYECPFKDELDLEESECARWDCPVCGNERETDSLPEDRDPDYEYDRRGDDD